MQSRRISLRLTAAMVVFWQLAAVVLGAVVLRYTEAIIVRTEPGTTACPVCEHQATLGAKCPMHATAEAADTPGGACVLTSGDNPTASLLTLMGSAGVLVQPLDADVPIPVDRLVVPSVLFLASVSPLPLIPPPRA